MNMDISDFTQDLYDLMGRNTNLITPRQFFDRYVLDDNAFMVCEEDGKHYILMDDFTITITENRK